MYYTEPFFEFIAVKQNLQTNKSITHNSKKFSAFNVFKWSGEYLLTGGHILQGKICILFIAKHFLIIARVEIFYSSCAVQFVEYVTRETSAICSMSTRSDWYIGVTPVVQGHQDKEHKEMQYLQ